MTFGYSRGDVGKFIPIYIHAYPKASASLFIIDEEMMIILKVDRIHVPKGE